MLPSVMMENTSVGEMEEMFFPLLCRSMCMVRVTEGETCMETV